MRPRRRVEYGDLRRAREKEREVSLPESRKPREPRAGEGLDREFWDRERPPHWG